MSFRNILRKCIEKTRRMIIHALKRWMVIVYGWQSRLLLRIVAKAEHRRARLSDVEADSTLSDVGGLIVRTDSEKLESIEGELLHGHDQVRLRQASSMAAEAIHDFPTAEQPGKQPSNVCHHCTLHSDYVYRVYRRLRAFHSDYITILWRWFL